MHSDHVYMKRYAFIVKSVYIYEDKKITKLSNIFAVSGVQLEKKHFDQLNVGSTKKLEENQLS